MRFSIFSLAEALLAVVALALLSALIIPWGDEAQKTAPGPAYVQVSADPASAQAQSNRVPPQAIASLFVKRSPPRLAAPAPASAPVVRKPVEAPWLSYLGFYSGAPGKPFYLLKDTRAGRVIKVAEGSVSNGWSLVETGDKRMVVRNNDDIYIVIKR